MQGELGEQGLQGEKGNTGNRGEQGLQGGIGLQGLQGIKGESGLNKWWQYDSNKDTVHITADKAFFQTIDTEDAFVHGMLTTADLDIQEIDHSH